MHQSPNGTVTRLQERVFHLRYRPRLDAFQQLTIQAKHPLAALAAWLPRSRTDHYLPTFVYALRAQKKPASHTERTKPMRHIIQSQWKVTA